MWDFGIAYHNNFIETVTSKPRGIDMFPNSAIITTESPSYEKMDPAWPDTFAQIMRIIRNCQSKLAVFQGLIPQVSECWESWATDMQRKINTIRASEDLPWHEGPETFTVLAQTLDVAHDEIAPLNINLLTDSGPFDFDPVLHVNYTESQRQAAMASARKPINLRQDSIVLVRLPFGASVPRTHPLPCCLAHLSENIAEGSALIDGAMFRFHLMFTRTTDLTGSWSKRNAAVALSLPLRFVLLTGLELTANRKLFATSQRLISAVVPEYEVRPVSSGLFGVVQLAGTVDTAGDANSADAASDGV
jgi:hypothetical protein